MGRGSYLTGVTWEARAQRGSGHTGSAVNISALLPSLLSCRSHSLGPRTREAKFCPLQRSAPLSADTLMCLRVLIASRHPGTAMPVSTIPSGLRARPDRPAWLSPASESDAGRRRPHQLRSASRLVAEAHSTSGKPHLAQVRWAAPPQRAFQNHCPIVPGGAGTSVA